MHSRLPRFRKRPHSLYSSLLLHDLLMSIVEHLPRLSTGRTGIISPLTRSLGLAAPSRLAILHTQQQVSQCRLDTTLMSTLLITNQSRPLLTIRSRQTLLESLLCLQSLWSKQRQTGHDALPPCKRLHPCLRRPLSLRPTLHHMPYRHARSSAVLRRTLATPRTNLTWLPQRKDSVMSRLTSIISRMILKMQKGYPLTSTTQLCQMNSAPAFLPPPHCQTCFVHSIYHHDPACASVVLQGQSAMMSSTCHCTKVAFLQGQWRQVALPMSCLQSATCDPTAAASPTEST